MGTQHKKLLVIAAARLCTQSQSVSTQDYSKKNLLSPGLPLQLFVLSLVLIVKLDRIHTSTSKFYEMMAADITGTYNNNSRHFLVKLGFTLIEPNLIKKREKPCPDLKL